MLLKSNHQRRPESHVLRFLGGILNRIPHTARCLMVKATFSSFGRRNAGGNNRPSFHALMWENSGLRFFPIQIRGRIVLFPERSFRGLTSKLGDGLKSFAHKSRAPADSCSRRSGPISDRLFACGSCRFSHRVQCRTRKKSRSRLTLLTSVSIDRAENPLR